MLKTLPLLILAAALEVLGDAAVRWGLVGNGRVLGLGIGAIILFAYSITVNTPRWEFGRLLGVYIAVFFLVSQVVSALVFREPVRLPTVVGGALIMAGGAVLTFWNGAAR